MKPAVITSLVLGTVLAVGAVFYLAPGPGVPPAATVAATLADPAGQFIEITAKDGYTPATTHARAGVPLALKITTDGTLDCSSSLRIPALGWAEHLAPTGTVAVPIPAQKAGTTLVGVCSMGMKSFKIIFD